MRTRPISLALVFLCTIAANAGAQDTPTGVEVIVRWGACPSRDADGRAMTPATHYEVFLESDSAAEVRVATVEGDTTAVVELPFGMVHRLRVVGYDANDRPSPPSEWSLPVYFDESRGEDEIPPAAQLRPNYPNPFNPTTRIVYGVPQDVQVGQAVVLEIYSPLGQRVRSFPVDRTPGIHEVQWDGTNDRGQPQATGLYLTRFSCGDEVRSRKMMMVK